MVAEPTGPWAFTDPRRDDSTVPHTDADTAALIDEAIDALILMRSPMHLGDSAATISALVSLTIEAESRLADAVADARNQDYGWTEIANRLATTAAAARHRYGAHARARKVPELD